MEVCAFDTGTLCTHSMIYCREVADYRDALITKHSVDDL